MYIINYIKYLLFYSISIYAFIHRFSIKRFSLSQTIKSSNLPNGFYGLIGPNINTSSIGTLFDLFMGDGIIQGVFIQSDNITFVKHIIKTDKWVYETEHGPLSKHPYFFPFYMFAHKLGMMPNIFDLANTAFLSIKNKTYSLFERDYPYEIYIKNNSITTLKKINVPYSETLSGHSIYNGSHVHSIDYNIILKIVRYLLLDEHFDFISEMDVPMKYIPIVHDFGILKNGFLCLDTPFFWNFSKTIPVTFDTTQPAFFHVYKNISKTESTLRTFSVYNPFYIFHYANIREHSNDTIDIYAPCYDKLDFSALDIEGKYRKIVIQLNSTNITVHKNPILENMNLDFPIRWKEYTILREIQNKTISSFVICKDLDFIKRIPLPNNRFFCGEPRVFNRNGSLFLIGFSYDENQMGYLSIINIWKNNYTEIVLNDTVTIGFHSILLTTNL